MKKLLLLGALASVIILSATAQKPKVTEVQVFGFTPKTATLKASHSSMQSSQLSDGKILQHATIADGKAVKRIVKNVVTASPRTLGKSIVKGEGQGLAENFEGCAGDGKWLPEGWSSKSLTPGEPNNWFMCSPSLFYANGYEGEYAAMISLSTEFCDEWLITPSFTVNAGEQLKFLNLFDLLFAIDWGYIDWETQQITEYHPSATLKVWASEDGENWTLLKDYFEDAVGLSYDELFDDYSGDFRQREISLADFEGKTIQIGFEYVGTDGNAVGIDDVRVGMPTISCNYDFPIWAPFFGIDRNLMGMSASIPVLPAFHPITWTAESDVDDASYLWQYYNAESELDFAFGKELEVTYPSDYSSDFTTRNNLFYPPTLMAFADGYTDGEISKYTYFQAGGRPDWDSKGEILSFGMAAHDPAQEGYTSLSDKNGTPLFGYNENTDAIWTNYYFGSDAGNSYAHLTGIMNVYVTPESPIVFKKAYAHAEVRGLKENAVLVLEVMPCDDEGMPGAPIATAVCTAEDAVIGLQAGSTTYYTFNFEFAEPIVVSRELGDMYILRLSNFNGCADFFAPMQSYWEAQNGINHGYMWFDVLEDGLMWFDVVPLYAITGIDQSFGIMIDGCYPWLQAPAEAGTQAGQEVELALDSFYDGSEIEVEAPEWLNVTVSGRYGDCKAVLKSTVDEVKEGDVVFKAPGVEATVKVSNSTSGIISIDNIDKKSITEVYNTQGVKMDADCLPSGIYVIRTSDGRTSKVTVK